MSELDVRTAQEQARAMHRYVEAFNGQKFTVFDDVDRQNLATALDNLLETAAMLGNVSDRLAALTSAPAEPPKGFVLVPVEPTPEMCAAAQEQYAYDARRGTVTIPSNIFRAMVGAAPTETPPAAGAIDARKPHDEALMKLSQFAHTAAHMGGNDMRNNLSSIADQLIALASREQEVQAAVGKFPIDVEKMLCAKLGREWSASGISIVSLIDALASRAAPQATGNGKTKGDAR